MNPNLELDALQRRIAERKQRMPVTAGQTAAVNLMGMSDAVQALIDLSRAGKRLPTRVPDEVYPGGVLPPGDVIPVEHYTHAPGGTEGWQAVDPAMYGSRPGPINQNAEWGRMQQNPQLQNSQWYIPGESSPEADIVRGATDRIEGALPGMYNMTLDPDDIEGMVRAQHDLEQELMGRTGPMKTSLDPTSLQTAIETEARRRGYAGIYRTDLPTKYKASASVTTPVDLHGEAPNIDAMRLDLGREVGIGVPERNLEAFGPYAQVTTETQPGTQYWARRYRGYADNPAKGAMLHADYERLLRDPDGGSVVAREMGLEDAPVRQGQGVYKGQRNPMAAARVQVKPPQITPDMDADRIAEIGLSKQDKAKLDAIATVEGMLRDQDAAAWNYPLVMTREADMPTQGIDWAAVNSAEFRSPGLRHKEVGMVADELSKMPVPDEIRPKWLDDGATMEDMIMVNEVPDTEGGILLVNIGNLEPKVFREYVDKIRQRYPGWFSSRRAETYWGRTQTGYIEQKDYNRTLSSLPEGLRARAEEALIKYEPYVQQVRDYHDKLRNVQDPEPMTPWVGTVTAPAVPVGLSFGSEVNDE